MFKKLLIASAVVLGLIYGSGHDIASIRQMVKGAANENARSFTNGSNDGWGADSGY